MTAPARVRVVAARRSLALGVGARAAIWGAAAGAALFAIVGLADWLVGTPRALRAGALPGCTAVGVSIALYALWRGRRVRSLATVALWLEERVPALHYSLVSAIEEPRGNPSLERVVGGVRWTSAVGAALRRALLPPLGVLVAATVLLLALPVGIRARIRKPRAGDALLRPPSATPARNRLSPLVADVIPPRYTKERATSLDEPSSVEAVNGTRVVLRGQGNAAGISATAGGSAVAVAQAGREWRVGIVMPAKPVAIALRDRGYGRSVILAPYPDSAPAVTLTVPARDTVMRALTGAFALGAQARDDYGLDVTWFEYIVSSGEGENFTFRSGVVRRATVGGARTAQLGGALRLDSLTLKPGDLVHVRAVARDLNNVTGPGIGVSETRTLRVPRTGEYDSVAVEAAPPPEADKTQLSERMLIILTEKLERRRPSLARSDLVKESRAIGSDQARLRQQVGEIVFARLGGAQGTEDAGSNAAPRRLSPDALLAVANAATQGTGGGATDFEGDETPVVAVNRPLLEAYNAMWDASRALEGAEPGAALPPMRAALAAIQRARNAERLYLRGRSAVVIVDIAKVRLAGKHDDASSSARTPRAVLDSSAERRASRFDAAVGRLASDPSAAIDSLLALRVDALESAPELSSALASAIDALRAGRDATAALVRARRTAGGAAVVQRESAWGGAW